MSGAVSWGLGRSASARGVFAVYSPTWWRILLSIHHRALLQSCCACLRTNFLLLLHVARRQERSDLPTTRKGEAQSRRTREERTSIRGEPPPIRRVGVRSGLGAVATLSTSAFPSLSSGCSGAPPLLLLDAQQGSTVRRFQCRHPGACIVLHQAGRRPVAAPTTSPLPNRVFYVSM